MENPSSVRAHTTYTERIKEYPFTREGRERLTERIGDRFGEEAAEEWKKWRAEVRRRRGRKWIHKQIRKEEDRHLKRIIQLQGALAENEEELESSPPLLQRAAHDGAENQDIDMLQGVRSRHREHSQIINMGAESRTYTDGWISVNEEEIRRPSDPSNEQAAENGE